MGKSLLVSWTSGFMAEQVLHIVKVSTNYIGSAEKETWDRCQSYQAQALVLAICGYQQRDASPLVTILIDAYCYSLDAALVVVRCNE
jgi:hypothetical protein